MTEEARRKYRRMSLIDWLLSQNGRKMMFEAYPEPEEAGYLGGFKSGMGRHFVTVAKLSLDGSTVIVLPCFCIGVHPRSSAAKKEAADSRGGTRIGKGTKAIVGS